MKRTMGATFWSGEVELSRLECGGKKYFWFEGEICDSGLDWTESFPRVLGRFALPPLK
jgi:hypothetical protein